MNILTVNIGSTSLKCQGFSFPSEKRLFKSRYQIDRQKSVFTIEDEEVSFEGDAYQAIFSHLIEQAEDFQWDAVVHRFVHGGVDCVNPSLINDDLLQSLQKWITVLPLHLPFNIEGYQVCQKVFSYCPHYAAFDNGCFQNFKPHVYEYALPKSYAEEYLVRRFGYHGLSHEYAVHRAADKLNLKADKIKMVTCHLGGGSSMSAWKNGEFVDTTMGMTAVSGLPMTTRCGDVDPAVVFHLLRNSSMSFEEIERVMYKDSGMKGLSGLSGDMRDLLAAKNNPKAQAAIQNFVYRIQKTIGAFYAAMQGVDVLLFTGGIGENAAQIREQVCSSLKCLGMDMDLEKNKENHDGFLIISGEQSNVKIVVSASDEGLHMARLVNSVN